MVGCAPVAQISVASLTARSEALRHLAVAQYREALFFLVVWAGCPVGDLFHSASALGYQLVGAQGRWCRAEISAVVS